MRLFDKLLCKHDWENHMLISIETLEKVNAGEKLSMPLSPQDLLKNLTRIRKLYCVCEKCGKIKKVRL